MTGPRFTGGPIYCAPTPYSVGTYTTPPEHSESCACIRPGDRECNCHLSYGFATAEDMDEADARDRAVSQTTPGNPIAGTLAFFASCIRNGEPWDDFCQQRYDEALAALNTTAQGASDA